MLLDSDWLWQLSNEVRYRIVQIMTVIR